MSRHPFNVFLTVAFALSVSVVIAGPGNSTQQDAIAFVGATLIDGTEADPIPDAIIVVAGDPEVIASYTELRRLFPWMRPTTVIRPRSVALKNLKRLQDAGVTVVAGSDAGNIGTLHGPALHRELEFMHTAGLASKELLVAATSGGARVMRREGELGTIEPGKLADFDILDTDPLKDIRSTRRINRVVKGGAIHDPDEILKNLSLR